MSTATDSWTTTETDPQRTAILDAADRLLAGTPLHSTGNLSVVQLAIEAQVNYWVVAQRHTDLRNHFQTLARAAGHTHGAVPATSAEQTRLREERDQLAQHCAGLEQLIQTYAAVINELATENEALRDQVRKPSASVSPLRLRQ